MFTIGIMQPYFFPYIGYFQLMNAVDRFVVYDNIQYTKKGWINRNRILADGKDEYICVPLKKASHDLNVKDRFLADDWSKDRRHMLNKIDQCYRKAPYFADVYGVIEECLIFEERNLFGFVLNSLKVVKDYLNINTPFVISSTVNVDHTLKGEHKVKEICDALGAKRYLNPIGGVELYDRGSFERAGIELGFIKTSDIRYSQFNGQFVPSLSIIDVMMFNDKKSIGRFLGEEFTIE